MRYKKLATVSLVDKCSTKDPLAWAEFVNRFSPLMTFSIKKALAKYSNNPCAVGEEIKDIQQNILLSIWTKNKLGEVKNRENINYWLVITTRNATINHLKAKAKEVFIAEESFFDKFSTQKCEKPKDAEENPRNDIKQSYNRLSPREKIVFKLYFEKELGLKDVSKIMHIPLGTVSSIVTRMRKKFKK